jgi:trehalose/maltose transport system permease protein
VSRPVSLQRRQERDGWLFLTPSLIILCIVGIYPLVQTFAVSLTDARMASGKPANFVGLGNYADLFGLSPFWQAVTTTLVFTVISVTIEIIIGLIIALMLSTGLRARGLLRAAILVPWALPTVVSARMWNYMLVDTYGVINDVLVTKLHLLPHKIAWLAQPGIALVSIIAVDVWKTVPFVVLLMLAGLQLIPRQTYEAAAVDGATRWQQFTQVTLPMLRPTILVVVIFRTLDALRIFDAVWVLTRGELATETMATFTYRQMIDFRKIGFGSAASVTIFALIAAFVIMYLVLSRASVSDEVR